jgi:HEAT repeat protein
MLASTIGTETNDDVRNAAISALANHKSPIAVDSLRTALRDRNPATQTLVIDSLRSATGKNYGDDPQVWIAALDGKPTGEVETKIAERVTDRAANLFR